MAIPGLSIRLYFDHNGSHRLANDLRNAGFDVVTAAEVGNSLFADPEHLQWATNHGRCIFTHDLDDFPILAVEWAHARQEHAGIIVALQPPRLPYGEMLRRMVRLLDTLTAEDLTSRLEWLDRRWSS